MAEMYSYLFNETLAPETVLTEGEAEYIASRGKSVKLLLQENNRAVAPDGSVGMLTFDGRVVSGADYAGGFCYGDIVRLKSGGPRMVVTRDAGHYYATAVCSYFDGGEYKSDKFPAETLEYLGHPEDLQPESAVVVVSLQEYRRAIVERGKQARALKARPTPKRRAA